jgi:hypothetical protein
MQVGFAALLEVLGFSSLVSGDGRGGRLQEYLLYLQAALGADTGRPEVDFVVFSDSIVLTTRDDSDHALQNLMLRCSKLLGQMLNSSTAGRQVNWSCG